MADATRLRRARFAAQFAAVDAAVILFGALNGRNAGEELV